MKKREIKKFYYLIVICLMLFSTLKGFSQACSCEKIKRFYESLTSTQKDSSTFTQQDFILWGINGNSVERELITTGYGLVSNRKRVGLWTVCYNGNVLAQYHFGTSGKLDGKSVIFEYGLKKNGKLRYSGRVSKVLSFRNGVYHGSSHFFKKGRLKTTYLVSNGEVIDVCFVHGKVKYDLPILFAHSEPFGSL